MGTRGAYGFRINSIDKIAYNHWDSYPECLGRNVLKYIDGTPIEMMKEVARNIILVNHNSHPSPQLIEKYKQYADLNVSNHSYNDWYCLLRKTQGDLFHYNNDLKHMVDYHNFLYDSLFCEWAYIINLDQELFEAYRGFNKNPKAKGRYAARKIRDNNGYRGVVLIKEIPLNDIKEARIEDYIAELNKIGKQPITTM